MGWLKRLFGLEKPKNPKAAISAPREKKVAQKEEIAPERVGLNGEYDQSGLAKRVALAFDEDPQINDEDQLWVAQTGSTVVLKGTASSQSALLIEWLPLLKGLRERHRLILPKFR